MIRSALLFLLALFAGGVLAERAHCAEPAALPGDSVYHLAVPLIDQEGRARALDGKRGEVVIVSMFYASCPYMCPLIIDTLRQSERTLDAEQRARLSVLLVSFDAKRDGPAELKAQATQRKIDTARWTLARTDASHVRKLAAALGIQYRELVDGEFSHSSVLILLDRDGRIVARTETMGKTDPVFIEALKKQLSGG